MHRFPTEAAYYDQGFFYEMIAPLMLIGNTGKNQLKLVYSTRRLLEKVYWAGARVDVLLLAHGHVLGSDQLQHVVFSFQFPIDGRSERQQLGLLVVLCNL